MKLFFLFIVVILFSSCQANDLNYARFENGKTVVVDLAVTDEERQRGLMYADELSENRGKLFVFEDEEIRSFWMKNVKFALDMIFISKNGEVVDIMENAEPCQEACLSYVSADSARYVLEINGGKAEEWGIDEGMKVELNFKMIN